MASAVAKKPKAAPGRVMKTLCKCEGLEAGFAAVSGVVPTRSPKPILQNIKFVADPDDGSVLMATDLEVGIRYRVLGVKVDRRGATVLPTQKFASVLRTGTDEELAVEDDGDELLVRGLDSDFRFPASDPDLFPDVPDFTARAYHVVAAADLKRLIRRTMFATDPNSTRYALGGALVVLTDESITLVATDGRRLAMMAAPAEVEGGEPSLPPQPVIPLKAMKLIDRNLDEDDPPVHLAFSDTGVTVRTERSVIYSRLVEGRFPRYEDVFPPAPGVRIPMEAGPLMEVLEKSLIVTSTESRGVDFDFRSGRLKLSIKTQDVGSADVRMLISHDGDPVEITFDPRYLVDALKTVGPTDIVRAELIDQKNAAVFRTEDGYAYVVMPLTRD